MEEVVDAGNHFDAKESHRNGTQELQREHYIDPGKNN
jgi:hypothetical protein